MVKRKDSKGRVLPDGVTERADGRYLYRYQYYGKTKFIYDRDLNALKDKILKKKMEICSGVNDDYAKLTLDMWFPQFIEIFQKNRIKASTLANQLNYYEWYVQGTDIGRMPIQKLKRTHMVNHFQKLADKKKLAHGTLRTLASLLYNCLQKCVYDGIINSNPAIDIMKDVVAKPKVEREALTEEETKVMIDFLKQEGWQNVYLPLIAIGLSTGFRFGELVGLTENDIDFKNKIIHINHTLHYRIKVRGEKHEFFVTTPKTKAGNRDFPMTDEVEKLLKMQLAYLKQMKIRRDISIDGYKGFIFVSKLGFPYTHEAITRTLKLVVKQANEYEAKKAEEEDRKPVIVSNHTPHVWRHTFTTRLVEAGVNYASLKNILGHRSVKTTIDVYNHITEKGLRKDREDLNNIISVI